VRDSRGLWRLPFFYPRGSQVAKPQKWGKAPLSAAVVCVEAHPDGPVLFDGWDADWSAGRPSVAVAAHPDHGLLGGSVRQRVARAAADDRARPAGERVPGYGPDEDQLAVGRADRAGDRVGHLASWPAHPCLSVQDQTESWLASNGGHKLRDSQRRGLAGTGGRFFETPNAWDPVESRWRSRPSRTRSGCTRRTPAPGGVCAESAGSPARAAQCVRRFTGGARRLDRPGPHRRRDRGAAQARPGAGGALVHEPLRGVRGRRVRHRPPSRPSRRASSRRRAPGSSSASTAPGSRMRWRSWPRM
jgi:hypothetical protein